MGTNNDQVYIGVAQSGDLALSNDPYSVGSVIHTAGAAAACAVKALGDGRYSILAYRAIPHGDTAAGVKALRRELAEAALTKPSRANNTTVAMTHFPEEYHVAASNSDEWRAMVAKREAAERAAAKAREAEIDRVGALYVARSDGGVNLARLANLLKAGKLSAVNAVERAPLHWLRSALESAQPIGVYGVALARAIAAADAGAQRGAARR